MKKKLCRITALLLAAVLSLGGCGQPGAGKKRTDSTQQTEETKVELQKPTEEVWKYLNAFARGFINSILKAAWPGQQKSG